MKKLFSAALAMILSLALSSCGGAGNTASVPAITEASVTTSHATGSASAPASAEETAIITTTTGTTGTTPPETFAEAPAPLPDFPVHTVSALYHAEDDTMLYEDNIHEHIAPASLTKLLTASVALKYLDPDAIITVGTEQSFVEPGSSICYVYPGSKLVLSDLLAGMLIASGNDAAYAVAVSAARAAAGDVQMSDSDAVQFFCGLMNDRASEIGMTDSNFTTPDGYDEDSQYTTAADLIVLAKHVLSVPQIKEIVGTYRKKAVYCSGEIAEWTNSNKLLDPDSGFYSEDAVGIKTGTTDKAGCCLIAAFNIYGETYITVVAGCETNEKRYELTSELISRLDYSNS